MVIQVKFSSGSLARADDLSFSCHFIHNLRVASIVLLLDVTHAQGSYRDLEKIFLVRRGIIPKGLIKGIMLA